MRPALALAGMGHRVQRAVKDSGHRDPDQFLSLQRGLRDPSLNYRTLLTAGLYKSFIGIKVFFKKTKSEGLESTGIRSLLCPRSTLFDPQH